MSTPTSTRSAVASGATPQAKNAGLTAGALPRAWVHAHGVALTARLCVLAPCRYSGLQNLGATCYINSVVQQLYMTPQLHTGLLAAPEFKVKELFGPQAAAADSGDLDAGSNGADGADGDAPGASAGSRPGSASDGAHHAPGGEGEGAAEASQAPADASGGPTRLAHPTTGGDNGDDAADGAGVAESKGPDAAEVTNTMLVLELQRLFKSLDNSLQRACNPTPFVKACSGLQLQFPVMHQVRAHEVVCAPPPTRD